MCVCVPNRAITEFWIKSQIFFFKTCYRQLFYSSKTSVKKSDLETPKPGRFEIVFNHRRFSDPNAPIGPFPSSTWPLGMIKMIRKIMDVPQICFIYLREVQTIFSFYHGYRQLLISYPRPWYFIYSVITRPPPMVNI